MSVGVAERGGVVGAGGGRSEVVGGTQVRGMTPAGLTKRKRFATMRALNSCGHSQNF